MIIIPEVLTSLQATIALLVYLYSYLGKGIQRDVPADYLAFKPLLNGSYIFFLKYITPFLLVMGNKKLQVPKL